ncbi:uncharacterized protein LOC124943781 [Impatiens glandulifera]|uniref:uncharacterized protein LOC124943781 n=1 Tax=Impatiens glandulifera TaxID=253017 RepID=UPI001FB0B8B7|nr:uncharacterized protein LOC124943781 [Impatiens glandulifera]
MASHLKSVKISTMTDEIQKTLCEHAKDDPSCTQKQLQQWVAEKFNLQVSQATISNTIKKSTDYLSTNMDRGGTKRHKELNYRYTMDAEKVIDYPSENKAAAEFLNDEQIISIVMENEKEDEAEYDSTELEPVSRKNVLQATITLRNFLLQYEHSTPQLHNALRMIQDEV